MFTPNLNIWLKRQKGINKFRNFAPFEDSQRFEIYGGKFEFCIFSNI